MSHNTTAAVHPQVSFKYHVPQTSPSGGGTTRLAQPGLFHVRIRCVYTLCRQERGDKLTHIADELKMHCLCIVRPYSERRASLAFDGHHFYHDC